MPTLLLVRSGYAVRMTELAKSDIPFMALASYPPRHGNALRPLVDGEPAFRRILEAVESAQRSVWLTVAFIRADFLMPDGRGSLFDVLDRAVASGLDVRALVWRPNPEARYATEGGTFGGTQSNRDYLASRDSQFRVRWDRAHAGFCQHQKCWVIDAGGPAETAFVGGINLNPRAMASPGHIGGGDIHDTYLEISGPAATDIHHNFVQRWNEASECGAEDGCWAHKGDDDLEFPMRLSAERGADLVQIQRNIHAGRYRNSQPSPGAASFDISAGECAIREQYLAALGSTRRSIYLEQQALSAPVILDGIEGALRRGVEVVALLPAEPEAKAHHARFSPLAKYDNFTLSGIAATDAKGARRPIYVHDKLMLVDDAWGTIGSCNLHHNSLFGHSELNASFWAPEVARALRCQLFAEHIGEDTSSLDDVAALRRYRAVALNNKARLASGEEPWQGLAFALDPLTYGM